MQLGYLLKLGLAGLLLSFAVFGETAPRSHEALLRAELRIQSQSILVEFSEEVDRELKLHGTIAAPRMITLFQNTTRRILREYERRTKKTGLAERLGEAFAYLDWHKVVDMAGSFRRKMGSTLKRHGPLAGISLALGTTVELVVDSALISVGMPYLIPVSLCTPYETVIFAGTKAVQAKLNRGRLATLYGGTEELAKVEMAQNEIRRELHLGAADDLLLPVVERRGERAGEKKLVVVTEPGVIRKALSFFGVRNRQVTLANVNRFFNEHLPSSVLPDALSRVPEMSPRVQTAMMVSHLYRNAAPETLTSFERQFGESILRRNDFKKSRTAKTLAWVEAFATVRTPEALKAHLQIMPAGEVSTKTMADLWSRVILPAVLANVTDLTYPQSKQLREAFAPLRAEAVRTEETAGEPWKQRLGQYVSDSLSAQKAPWCSRGFGLFARR